MTELRSSDTEAIRSLASTYCLGLDRFDLDLAVSVFSPDAQFDATAFGIEMLEGREAIRDFLAAHQATVEAQMHLVGNHLITTGDDGTIAGTSYLLEEGVAKDGTVSRVHALYTDGYVKTTDGWRIERRKVELLIPM
jgi:ketosteroid isomerase-like protein